MKSSRMFAALVGASLVASLTACSPVVSLEPAELANDPGCAAVSVRLPDTLAELNKRSTDAQATAAWGEPAGVILRCGLPAVEASTLKCVTTSDIDWLVDDSNAPKYRFITFARNPAVEVIVDASAAAGVTVLDELAPAIDQIAATKRCIG